MTSGHTPGPWKDASMFFSAGWKCVVHLPGGRYIDVADPRDRKTDDEDKANAALVASAPDLLAERDSLKLQLKQEQKANSNAIDGWVQEQARVIKERDAAILQNDELKKLLVRVYACHQPDVCDCSEPADAPHSNSCISTRVAEVSLQALTEKRICEHEWAKGYEYALGPGSVCRKCKTPWLPI